MNNQRKPHHGLGQTTWKPAPYQRTRKALSLLALTVLAVIGFIALLILCFVIVPAIV